MNNVHTALPDTVRQLFARIRRSLNSALEAQGLNISLPETHILYQIQIQSAIAPLEIALNTGYDKGFVTRKIKAMEEAGLILRQKDERDQRRCNLHLTSAGIDCCRRIADARQQAHSAVFHPLSPAEQQLLNELMEKCLSPSE